MSSRFYEKGRVAYRRDLGNGYFVLGVECPKVAAAAAPGQFVMVGTPVPSANSFDPLLPRPFTFLKVERGLFELYVHRVGRGTALLAGSNPGDTITVLGPLGRGFFPPADPAVQALLVAGSIGVAPFLHFAKQFALRPRPVLLYGARTANDLHLIDELREVMDVELITEDGSLGDKGRVTLLLERWISRKKPIEIYTCGPDKMMEAVTLMAKGLPVQASLEARMACGLGLCRGCAVGTAKGYVEVCVDGPVYDAHGVWG